MSAKTIYTCDYCGAACSGNIYASLWGEGDETKGYKHTRLDGCSQEHLGLVVAKTVGMNANAPANQCTDAERKQFEITIEQQKGRIAELEKQLATLNDWASICSGKAQTVDGKTPAQVGRAEYEVAYHAQMGTGCSLNASYLFAWERAAQAVLRTFGPALAKQAAADALGKARDRLMPTARGEHHNINTRTIQEAFDVELARIEAQKLAEPSSITIPTKPTKPFSIAPNCTICGCPNERAFLELCRGDAKHNFEVAQ